MQNKKTLADFKPAKQFAGLDMLHSTEFVEYMNLVWEKMQQLHQNNMNNKGYHVAKKFDFSINPSVGHILSLVVIYNSSLQFSSDEMETACTIINSAYNCTIPKKYILGFMDMLTSGGPEPDYSERSYIFHLILQTGLDKDVCGFDWDAVTFTPAGQRIVVAEPGYKTYFPEF